MDMVMPKPGDDTRTRPESIRRHGDQTVTRGAVHAFAAGKLLDGILRLPMT